MNEWTELLSLYYIQNWSNIGMAYKEMIKRHPSDPAELIKSFISWLQIEQMFG